MESKFITELDTKLIDDDKTWMVVSPLMYQSEFLDTTIIIPSGFQTDFASVPRIPIIYMFFGDRAHRESVLHDYLYRIDSKPVVSFSQANKVFLESMKCRNKNCLIYWTMYLGVKLGGCINYHKKKVMDKL